jgi:phage terminase large subunit
MNINISKNVFNPVYLPYLENNDRILIIYGGAGSGKSYFIAQRYIYRLLHEPKRVLLVVRQVGKTNRDSTYALFKQVISSWNLDSLFKFNESDMRIRCSNGAEILFAGLDDVEKLKSITGSKNPLSDIWVEEASETQESAFNQLNVRLRGGSLPKQIVMSFNPIDINHWIKTSLIDKNKGTVLKTTYKDNIFIDDDYKRQLESFRETDPYYYQVYCLGEWGVYGDSIFDKNRLAERFADAPMPIKSGIFMNGRFVNDNTGYILIYKDAEPYVPYVLGADTAGEGSDYFAAHVLNNLTGEQVAVLHGKFDEDLFAQQIYQLGLYYNTALLGIEANFSTYPIRELERLHYPLQYWRERMDSATHRLSKTYGFKTTSSTRPVIISDLVRIVREEAYLINDRETLHEMQTFVRNDKGRPEASEGCHDDLVMSLAIAHFLRGSGQQSSKMFTKKEKKKEIFNFSFERKSKINVIEGEKIYDI